jgi:proteasome accessory factor A
VRLVDEKRVLRAMVEPPQGTRAYFRGKCLEKFGDAIVALNWDSIEFRLNGRVEVLELKDLVDTESISCYNQILDTSHSVEDLMNRILPAV